MASLVVLTVLRIIILPIWGGPDNQKRTKRLSFFGQLASRRGDGRDHGRHPAKQTTLRFRVVWGLRRFRCLEFSAFLAFLPKNLTPKGLLSYSKGAAKLPGVVQHNTWYGMLLFCSLQGHEKKTSIYTPMFMLGRLVFRFGSSTW